MTKSFFTALKNPATKQIPALRENKYQVCLKGSFQQCYHGIKNKGVIFI